MCIVQLHIIKVCYIILIYKNSNSCLTFNDFIALKKQVVICCEAIF